MNLKRLSLPVSWMHGISFRTVVLSIFFSLVPQPGSDTAAQTELVVDIGKEYQRIDNFGASDAWSIEPTILKWMHDGEERAIEGLADLLFSTDQGIGLSAWRFNVGAGSAEQGSASRIPDPFRRVELMMPAPDAAIDRTKQRGQIRMLLEAHEHGVRDFVAFANSPPVWATKNGLTHPGDGTGVGSSNLAPEHRREFAEFLVAVVGHLRGEAVGVPVNYLSPVNEPTWDWEGQTQEGSRYSVDDIKLLYREVDRALASAGLGDKVHLDGPEVVEYTAALRDDLKIEFDGKPYSGGMNQRQEGLYRNYIDQFLGDEEMRKMLRGKLSLHGYFADAWEDRMGQLRDLTRKNVLMVAPEARLWMSEFCILGDVGNVRPFGGTGFDPDDMGLALHVAKVIHRDLTRLHISAWQWWLALTPYDYKDGLIKIDPALDPRTLQPSKTFWALGNFSRFIRPGDVRIGVTNPDDLEGLMVSAYRSPAADRIVVIVVNGGAESTMRLSFDSMEKKIRMGPFRAYVTEKTRSLEEFSGASPYRVPARSVVTFVADAI